MNSNIGFSGVIIKVVTKEQQDSGEVTVLPKDSEYTEIDLSTIGIIDQATTQGRAGVTFCFQHEGVNHYYVGTLTERLMDGLCAAWQGAKQRFAMEKKK